MEISKKKSNPIPIILGVILLLALVGYGAYSLLFKKGVAVPAPEKAAVAQAVLPTGGETFAGKLGVIEGKVDSAIGNIEALSGKVDALGSCKAVCPPAPVAKKAPPKAHRPAPKQVAAKATPPAPSVPPPQTPPAVIAVQPPVYLPANPPSVTEKECCTPLPKAVVIREEKAKVCGIAIQKSVSDATIVGRLQLDEDPANPGKIRVARVVSFEGVATKVAVSPYRHSKMSDGKGDCNVDQATIYQHWPEVIKKFDLPIECIPVKG